MSGLKICLSELGLGRSKDHSLTGGGMVSHTLNPRRQKWGDPCEFEARCLHC